MCETSLTSNTFKEKLLRKEYQGKLLYTQEAKDNIELICTFGGIISVFISRAAGSSG